MLYCHKGRGTEGMKDKGSREAPFFLLKISHRNAYRQANIFKVFGFSEGGESKKANCTTFLRIASVLYTGRHALRPVMCMERFYPTDMLQKLGSSVYVLPFSFVRQISVFMR